MQDYLQAMGIPVWRLREAAHQDVPNPPVDEPTHRFVFVHESAFADNDLLAKIIQAVGCTSAEVQCLAVDSPDALHNQTWQDVPVIVFGAKLYDVTPPNAIQTVTLKQLAHDTAAKKVLWQQLKCLINR